MRAAPVNVNLKMLISPAPQKFNTFNTFNIFNTFDPVSSCTAPALRMVRSPSAVFDGPGTRAGVPSGPGG